MSHQFRIHYSKDVEALLAKGYAVLPQHADDLEYETICVDNPCSGNGYTECTEEHICEHGCNAREGFEEDDPDGKTCPGHHKMVYPGSPEAGLAAEYSDNCWAGEEDFEFHGVMHTYRYGYGWTVPFVGCIVRACMGELPDGYDTHPVGLYELDLDWEDDSAVYGDVGQEVVECGSGTGTAS